MLLAAFNDKKKKKKKCLMPVWRPPPGLPECEWTSVNKRQAYTNSPAAIGPSRRGGECVGDAKQQQQQQGEPHARAPLLFFLPSLLIKKRHRHRRGLETMGRWQKNWPVGGSPLAPVPASMDMNGSPSPRFVINTYSTNRQWAAVGKSPNQHFKTAALQWHQSARIVIWLSALMG